MRVVVRQGFYCIGKYNIITMIILKLDCFARELFMNDAGGLSLSGDRAVLNDAPGQH